MARSRQALRFRYLALEQERIARAELTCLEVLSPSQRVGSGCDDDLVGTLGVDGYEGGPRGRLHTCDTAEVDTGLRKQRERRLGETVAADRTDQRDPHAGTACGQRLVRALAAGMNFVSGADHCLAGRGQPRHRCDQIDIDRAEDDDHGSALARRRMPATNAVSGVVSR